eukprot:351479-Chlamydomonas_euryale.AAC.29
MCECQRDGLQAGSGAGGIKSRQDQVQTGPGAGGISAFGAALVRNQRKRGGDRRPRPAPRALRAHQDERVPRPAPRALRAHQDERVEFCAAAVVKPVGQACAQQRGHQHIHLEQRVLRERRPAGQPVPREPAQRRHARAAKHAQRGGHGALVRDRPAWGGDTGASGRAQALVGCTRGASGQGLAICREQASGHVSAMSSHRGSGSQVLHADEVRNSQLPLRCEPVPAALPGKIEVGRLVSQQVTCALCPAGDLFPLPMLQLLACHKRR